MRKLIITFAFVLGCFTTGASSQCKFPWPPPPTTVVGRAMVWSPGAPEFNIQNEPDFTIKGERDSRNDLEIIGGEIRLKGTSFAPPARIKAPVSVYGGFFNEKGKLFGTGPKWSVVVPKNQPVNKLLLLDEHTCTSKSISVGSTQLGRLVWKDENNFLVCDSNRSAYAQVNALTSAVKQGVASAKFNPCGYYIPFAGTNPIPIRVGDRWGYSDINKKVLIEPRYDNANPFSDGLAVVHKGPKCGYVDKKGVEVIPIEYDSCYRFADGAAKIQWRPGFVTKDGWMLIDHGNKRLDVVSFWQQDFSDGISVELNSKYAKNPDGDVTIALSGDLKFGGSYSEGLACVESKNNGRQTKPGSGFVDKNGKVVFWTKYSCDGQFSEALTTATIRPNFTGPSSTGFLDRRGNVAIPFRYEIAYRFKQGFALVKENGRWATIGRTGRVIAFLDYDDVGYSYDGLIPVSKNKKWGFVDKGGKTVIALKYDRVDFFDGLPYAVLNGKHFNLGKDGTEFYIPK